MSPSALQLICQLAGTVPIGAGRFATTTSAPIHVPAGAGQQSVIPIGTVAGSVGDVGIPSVNVIPSAAAPQSIALSSLNNPAGINTAFLHITHLLIENLDTTYPIVISRAASNGVSFIPAVANVNAVFAMPFVDTSGSGTFKITVEGVQTGAITYNATPATLVASINTALNTTFGASAIVASGSTLAGIILTCSGTGYSGRPVTTSTTTLVAGSTGYTINGVGTVGLNTNATVSTPGGTGGIVIPASQSASQSSFLLLAVPAGMPITLGSSDQITISTAAGAVNTNFILSVLGRNT